MQITDEELMEKYLKGDQQSLDFLIDRYLKPLYNFVYQLVGDQAASEDVVQETFFKAWKNIKKFDKNKKFSTWLFAIAKNNAFDWLRKRRETSFSYFEDEEGNNFLENIEDETVLYSNELLNRMDQLKDAQEILDSLNPELKTILLLHHKHGFSLVEVAQIMRKPTNTLKSKYRRTINQLRENLLNKKACLSSKMVKLVDDKSI